MKLNGTQLEIEQAIVHHLGLGSTMDIMSMTEQEYRLEVILEDGSHRIVNKSPIMEYIKQNAR